MNISALLRAAPLRQTISIGLLKAMPVDNAAHEAATSPLNLKRPPTKAQARAGNYPKGHTSVAGIPISIENPAGSTRRPEWAPLTAHYGYIKRTTGADGDNVDVFVRPSTANNWVGDVYVINQPKQDDPDHFDEHKVMVGWPDERSAVRAYLGNYPKGWQLGPVVTMSAAQFRTWVRDGDHAAPLRKYNEDQLRDDSGRWSGGGIPMDVNHEAHMAGHLRASNKLMQMSRDADATGDHDKARELRSQSHQRHAMAMAHQDVHLAQIKQKETNQRRAETRARNLAAAGKVSIGLLQKYSEDQPRDEQGRWSGGGDGGTPTLETLFSDNLGHERANMPQIPVPFREEFVSELKAAGIGVKAETVPARSLKPTQKDYKASLIEHVRADDAAGKFGTEGRTHIMVSREGRVLDGHHRWAMKAQDNKSIDVLRVDAPIRELMDRALIFNVTHGIERRTTKVNLAGLLRKYSEDQPRDERGRWTAGGGAEGGGSSEPPTLSAGQVIPKAIRDEVAALVSEHAGHAADVAASLTKDQKETAASELATALKGAHEDKPGFDTRLHEIANNVNGAAKTAPVKGGSRLLEKHVLENASDPKLMRDLVRGSVIVNSPADAARVLGQIKNQYEVTRVKDRFANPLPTGYRDMLINVRLPSGIEGEIQVHVPEMIAAKELGHAVYNIERSTPPGAEKSAMVQLQSQIYGAAVRSNRERTGHRQQG